MKRTIDKWDRFFLRVAREAALMSKDPSSQIGAVIVDSSRRIIATGYNGFPPGIADTPARLNDRDTKLKLVVHAETNALLQAGDRARGCTLYMFGFSSAPCDNCTKHVIASGITRVVGCGTPVPDRWKANLEEAEDTLAEAGVGFKCYDLDLIYNGPELTHQEIAAANF